MKHDEAVQEAQFILDSEFEEVNRNPKDYCSSMGWAEDSNGTKKAIEKQGTLAPTADDIEALAKIIVGLRTNSSIKIAESNAVSDFRANCVAGYILK